ncbi:MAG TPA: 23S rRNA (guanosine(2251)-2'-O)-methyltransferase RlmB [Actinomycetota bacterium]
MASPKAPLPPDEIVFGRRPVVEALRAGQTIQRLYLASGSGGASSLDEIRRRARQAGVPIAEVARAELDRLSGGGNHQGVVAHTARYRYSSFEDLVRGASALLFLDGVTDPHNVGALIRTAGAAGFDGVVLPSRRSSGVTAAVRRVSAGATETVPVARVANISGALEQAKSAGLWIVGLDEGAGQDVWSSNLAEPPVGLVLGAEGKGLSRNVVAHCDGLVRIPMQGRVESLNVSVAGGIAMFEIARRGEHSGTLHPAGSSAEPRDGEERRRRA